MPGRLAIFDDSCFKNDITKTLGSFKDEVGFLTPKYNIAPTIDIPVLLNNRTYTLAHFGLIPSWAKDKKSININARCETIYEKNSFREAFKNRRCLILINGYYEWKKENKESFPYFLKPFESSYFALAGVYENWFDKSTNKFLLGVALITTKPNSFVEKLHDRMPVILEKKDWKLWLDGSIKEANTVFKPISENVLSYYEVSSYVNSVANDSIKCLDEKKDEVKIGQLSLF